MTGDLGEATGSVPAESLAAAALTLARRFAAGATMWVVSPEWPSHGRHVAVEFVHPVVVGKRALPAVHVHGEGVTATLRLLARPGDVLVAVGPAGGATAALLRRAEAWGLSTLWLGAGPEEGPAAGPAAGSAACPGSAAAPAAARHVIWSTVPDAATAARSGDVVILYHLLWELTHVVFEHPGLLADPAPCDGDGDGDGRGRCVTCSDEAVVAEVVSVGARGEAEVVTRGRHESVDVSLVDGVSPGDLVLVHAGVAVTGLDDCGDREWQA